MEKRVPDEGGGVVGEGAECFIEDSHEAIFRTLDGTEGGGSECFI